MGKGDHIVIPKSILKRFMSDNNKISILYLKNGKKDEKFPDEIYTEKNYYLKEVDDFVRDKCESIIGELYASLKQEIKYVKERNIELMKEIFIIQHLRSTTFINGLKINDEFERKNRHNNTFLEMVKYLKKENIEEMDLELKSIFEYVENMYKRLTPGFLVLENTNRELIISSSQFAYIILPNYNMYLYTIAPDVALIWRENQDIDNFKYSTVNDDKSVENINKLIINCENKKIADKKIFGTKKEIEIIYSKIDDYK